MPAVVTRTVDAPAPAVYGVLADAWSYGAWVVGASRVRDVEGDWPAEGAIIHHSVGLWPVMVDDRTRVVASDEHRRLEMAVAVWFLGRGRVVIELEPDGPDRCVVTMREWMTGGLLSVLPDLLVDPVLRGRNTETLKRLEALARGRL